MKTPPIVITLGGKAYSVRIPSEHLDRFYEIVRIAAPNKVLNSSPLLDDELTEELWAVFASDGAHRMLIETVLEHLTSVGGDLDNAPISPSQMQSEMISSLPDDEDTGS